MSSQGQVKAVLLLHSPDSRPAVTLSGPVAYSAYQSACSDGFGHAAFGSTQLAFYRHDREDEKYCRALGGT